MKCFQISWCIGPILCLILFCFQWNMSSNLYKTWVEEKNAFDQNKILCKLIMQTILDKIPSSIQRGSGWWKSPLHIWMVKHGKTIWWVQKKYNTKQAYAFPNIWNTDSIIFGFNKFLILGVWLLNWHFMWIKKRNSTVTIKNLTVQFSNGHFQDTICVWFSNGLLPFKNQTRKQIFH
jgi:hypothetical protein